MVKVGFIVEGASEKIVVESEKFRQFLEKNGFKLADPVIDVKGAGNLLPDHIEPFIETLEKAEVEKLYILTDSDGKDIEEVKNRIRHERITAYFIAVKALEAWFLADTEAMKKFLNTDSFSGEEFPEQTQSMPWDRFKEIAEEIQAVKGRGTNKVAFAKKMINHWGFSIENAAQHPNCPSAKEVVRHFQENQPNATLSLM